MLQLRNGILKCKIVWDVFLDTFTAQQKVFCHFAASICYFRFAVRTPMPYKHIYFKSVQLCHSWLFLIIMLLLSGDILIISNILCLTSLIILINCVFVFEIIFCILWIQFLVLGPLILKKIAHSRYHLES